MLSERLQTVKIATKNIFQTSLTTSEINDDSKGSISLWYVFFIIMIHQYYYQFG